MVTEGIFSHPPGKKNFRELMMLNSCFEEIVRAQDENTLLQAICRIIVEEGTYPFAWIGLVNRRWKRINPVASWGSEKEDVFDDIRISYSKDEFGKSLASKAVRKEKLHVCNDAMDDPNIIPWPERLGPEITVKSCISAPIIHGGVCLGNLDILSSRKNAFDEKELKLIKALAENIAFGIVSIRTTQKHKDAEQRLRDSEERLKLILETSKYGTWELDIDSDRIKFNDRWLQTMGYETENTRLISTDSFLDYVAPTDREKLKKTIQSYLEGLSEKIDVLCRMRNQSGELHWVLIRAVSSGGSEKKVLLGSIEDMTEQKRMEELKKALAFNQGLLDSIPFPTSYKGPDGRYLGCNKAFEFFEGYSREKIIGSKVSDIMPAKKARMHEKIDQEILELGGVKKYETSRKLPNGETADILITKSAFYKPDGEIGGIITSTADITELKRIEEELRKARDFLEERIKDATRELHDTNAQLREEIKLRKQTEINLRKSESRFRAIAETSPVGLLIISMQSEKILFMNPQALKLFKIKEKNLASFKFENFCQNQTVRKRILSKLPEKYKIDNMELKLKKVDGTSFSASCSFQFGEHNDEKAIFTGITDITDQKKVERNLASTVKEFQKEIIARKKAETALRKSEEQYRILTENAQVGIWQISPEGKIIFVNPKMCELLEIDNMEEIKNKNCFSFLPDDSIKLEKMEHTKQNDKFLSCYEAELQGNKGTRRHVLVSGLANFSNPSKLEHYTETFTDITDRKKAEQEAEHHRMQLIQADKMISLGILVSGVAHEINNPTNFIMLNAPLLREAWDSAKPILDSYYKESGEFSLAGLPFSEMQDLIPSLFDGLMDGANRIKDIVSGLKDYARQDSYPANTSVNVNDAVYTSLTLLSNMIKKSTKHLEVDYCEGLPPIQGSTQRLEQVIINVIQNACQSLESNEKKLSISTHHRNSQVHIIIEDEGVGIKEEDMSHILDPFFTTKRDSGGTGLGLSITAGIVKDLKGKLVFDSTPGKGTTAKISFPASEYV